MPQPMKPLIIFEMANNHMGSLDHGLRILAAFAECVRPFRQQFDFAFKLQYRDLDTFIHPEFQGRTDIKFVKRFEETRLSEAEFLQLRDAMREQGFLAVCTPFDERSVDRVEAHGFDFLKIASCSLGDWPLMERMGRSSLPIIASTAGSDLELLDRVVNFFENRNRALSILHCVAEYPTPSSQLQLDQIDLLRSRYANHPIGFSTHEDPANTLAVQLALAKGVCILEKHVGLPTPQWPLNAYSADPGQITRWLEAAAEALEALGSPEVRYQPSQAERESLQGLRRGVFLARPVKEGERLELSSSFLAIPTVPGQITANDLSKYTEFIALGPVPEQGPALWENFRRIDNRERVYQIVQRVRTFLQESHTVVSTQAEVEISHHYGLDHFEETGATILSIVNRAYCKKLIALLPGQRHPEQYHQQKEETFHVLHGSLKVRLDGVERVLEAGEVLTVERGIKHEFWTESGTIIEEISSTHFRDDSFYTDPSINQNPNRKTVLTYFFG
ncbi:MAG: N-acetylneuraminic acid synthase domain protein [Holophagaceae bacterium]|nr:N-acetylneuraminic acid synthase domain protein [Holophagaceae bacterium]